MEKKIKKKTENNSKKSEIKNVAKEKSSTSDTSSNKTKSSNKSAAQLSISHFSSVSTPEYREGWDRIWGKGKTVIENKKTNLNNSDVLKDFTLFDKDIPISIKKEILNAFKIKAKNKLINIPNSNLLKLNNLKFSCKIDIKEK